MSEKPKRYFQAWLIDIRFQGKMLTSHFKGVMPAFAECALHHSITSSARNRSDGGTERPSALAILTLIAISNFTGTWTGKSAGLAPRRMRSTYGAARRTISLRSGPYEIKPPSLATTNLQG